MITQVSTSVNFIFVAILVLCSISSSSGAPRPDLSLFSALRGRGNNHEWGLNPAAFKENLKIQDAELHKTLRSNDPYVNFLMRDQIFVQHLHLFLRNPDSKHLNLLRNRVRTLSRRRSDEASTRFFLRD